MTSRVRLEPLRQTLKELGYEEGKNIRLDWRNLADEEAARATAREFVRDRVDLIVAFEAQTVRATKAATSDIPPPSGAANYRDPLGQGLASFVKKVKVIRSSSRLKLRVAVADR